ncbi:MAG: hypothetical protein J6B07_05745 [Opitutales bacterium]|nr:hypothetical protein [Opitutales bacterium]
MKQLRYYLLWKGVESGPFSSEEIERKLKFGEIGLLYKIKSEIDSEYFLLKDYEFTSELEKYNECKWVRSMFTEYALYILSGLSFLSKWIVFVSIMASVIVWIFNNRELAKKNILITLFMGCMGFVFFEMIYPVLIQ